MSGAGPDGQDHPGAEQLRGLAVLLLGLLLFAGGLSGGLGRGGPAFPPVPPRPSHRPARRFRPGWTSTGRMPRRCGDCLASGPCWHGAS